MPAVILWLRWTMVVYGYLVSAMAIYVTLVDRIIATELKGSQGSVATLCR